MSSQNASRRTFLKTIGGVGAGLAVTPLTRKSVAEDGMPQDFLDFTRGEWKTTLPLAVIS